MKYYEIIKVLSSVNSPPADLRIQMLRLPCLGQNLTNAMKEAVVAIIIDGGIEARMLWSLSGNEEQPA